MTPKNLKNIRSKTGLSQKDFGQKTGYSRSYIANMECGIMEITKRAEKIFKNVVDEV